MDKQGFKSQICHLKPLGLQATDVGWTNCPQDCQAAYNSQDMDRMHRVLESGQVLSKAASMSLQSRSKGLEMQRDCVNL